MFLALGLYALALAILGNSQCREMVDIPLLVSANPEDLEALEKAVKRSGGRPWSPEFLRRNGLPTIGRSLLCIEVEGSSPAELSRLFARIRERIHLMRTLLGSDSVRFHVYITQDCPTSVGFLVGYTLGLFNHKEYRVYHRWGGEILPIDRGGGRQVEVRFLRVGEEGEVGVDLRDFVKRLGRDAYVLVDATPSALNIAAMRSLSSEWLVIRIESKARSKGPSPAERRSRVQAEASPSTINTSVR